MSQFESGFRRTTRRFYRVQKSCCIEPGCFGYFRLLRPVPALPALPASHLVVLQKKNFRRTISSIFVSSCLSPSTLSVVDLQLFTSACRFLLVADPHVNQGSRSALGLLVGQHLRPEQFSELVKRNCTKSATSVGAGRSQDFCPRSKFSVTGHK